MGHGRSRGIGSANLLCNADQGTGQLHTIRKHAGFYQVESVAWHVHFDFLLQFGYEAHSIFLGFALLQVRLDIVDTVTEFLDGGQILAEYFGHVFALKDVSLIPKTQKAERNPILPGFALHFRASL